MSLPITRRYKLPPDRSLHSSKNYFSADMLPAIRSAEDILTQAKIDARQLQEVAQAHAQAHLEQIELEARHLSTNAALVAQREVWQGVLEEWLVFVKGLQAQREITREALQTLCSMVLEKIRTNTSVEEKLESSISLVLDHWVDSRRGELHVHVDELEAAQAALRQTGRLDIPVKADLTVAKGACILRCGDLSFATDFGENLDALILTLHDVLQMQ